MVVILFGLLAAAHVLLSLVFRSRSKAPRQKSLRKKATRTMPPTISLRYKSQKKNSKGWIFFLGLVDPSRNKSALTAYFAIILGDQDISVHFRIQIYNCNLHTTIHSFTIPSFHITVREKKSYCCFFLNPNHPISENLSIHIYTGSYKKKGSTFITL